MNFTKRKLAKEFHGKWNDIFENAQEYSGSNLDLAQYDQAVIPTNDGRLILGFLYVSEGNSIIIPEPDPSILYLTNAEREILALLKLKKYFNDAPIGSESAKTANKFFDFFQHAMNFTINLCASIEAFHNSVIPHDFRHKRKSKYLSKNEIQRFCNFEEKAKKILPLVYKRSYVQDFGSRYDILLDLKKLRDGVIHTKDYSSIGQSVSYRKLYIDFLNFDFENSLLIVKEYINYYEPDHIEKGEQFNI